MRDGAAVRCEALSATGSRIARLEADRAAAGIAQATLAASAGVSLRSYTRLVTEGDSPKLARQKLSATDTKQEHRARFEKKVDRLERALAALTASRPRPRAEGETVAAMHRAVASLLASSFGVTAEAVLAADPRAGATADPVWRACRHASQAALYLTNTTLGVPQRVLADVLGLTPAAVCLAIKAVEDRRDDPHIDAALTRAARLIAGRAE